MSIHESLEEICNWLDQNGLPIDELPNGADKIQFSKLQTAVNRVLPKDFVELYSMHNGLSEWLHFDKSWEVLDIEYIIKYYKENLDLFDDIIADEAWKKIWLPFASNGSGDYLFIDLDRGTLGEYFHEGGYSHNLGVSLKEFFSKVATDLRDGRYKYSPEYGLEMAYY